MSNKTGLWVCRWIAIVGLIVCGAFGKQGAAILCAFLLFVLACCEA